MADLYARLRGRADKMIAKRGFNAMLYTENGDHPCKCVLDSFVQKEIDGTHIRSGDQKVLISVGSLPAGVRPQTGMRLAWASPGQPLVARPITWHDAIEPGNQSVLFQVGTRGQ